MSEIKQVDCTEGPKKKQRQKEGERGCELFLWTVLDMFNHIFRIKILVERKLQLLKSFSQNLEFYATAKPANFLSYSESLM